MNTPRAPRYRPARKERSRPSPDHTQTNDMTGHRRTLQIARRADLLSIKYVKNSEAAKAKVTSTERSLTIPRPSSLIRKMLRRSLLTCVGPVRSSSLQRRRSVVPLTNISIRCGKDVLLCADTLECELSQGVALNTAGPDEILR